MVATQPENEATPSKFPARCSSREVRMLVSGANAWLTVIPGGPLTSFPVLSN